MSNVPAKIIPPGLLTPNQAAARLGKDVKTVRKDMRSGEIPAAVLPGSRRLFVSAAILERYARRKGIALQ